MGSALRTSTDAVLPWSWILERGSCAMRGWSASRDFHFRRLGVSYLCEAQGRTLGQYRAPQVEQSLLLLEEKQPL